MLLLPGSWEGIGGTGQAQEADADHFSLLPGVTQEFGKLFRAGESIVRQKDRRRSGVRDAVQDIGGPKLAFCRRRDVPCRQPSAVEQEAPSQEGPAMGMAAEKLALLLGGAERQAGQAA